MKRIFTLSLAALALTVVSVQAQNSTFLTPIVLKNGSVVQTIRLGVSPLNTFGVDSDTLLGPLLESAAPPKPPVFQLDGRFRTIPGRVSTYPTGLAGGVFKDVRDNRSASQVDSFLVEISGNGLTTDNTTITWPSGLDKFGTAWEIKSVGSSVLPATNMITTPLATIPSDPFTTGYFLLIVKSGALAHPAPQASVVTKVDNTGLISFVDPIFPKVPFIPGISISASTITTSGAIQVDRYTAGATSVSFSTQPPSNVSQYRFVITNAGTVGLAGTLRFDFSKFAAGITNGASVTVFRRAVEGTGAFDPVATTFVPGSTELSVPFAFGEYVFGSSGNTLTSADDQNAPLQFALRQNYPNPFNPSTSIAFSIPTTGRVLLEVYNLLGQKVGTLVNGVLPAGQHLRTFAPTSLSSGIYIYRLEAGASVAVRRMAFVK